MHTLHCSLVQVLPCASVSEYIDLDTLFVENNARVYLTVHCLHILEFVKFVEFVEFVAGL